ncbi:MAG: Calx-beta domain-containing protein, partial [Verrucomicrobiota bacterium]
LPDLQNGVDAVALYYGGDFPTNTAVTTTNLIDAVVYRSGSQSDGAGLSVLLTAGGTITENDTQSISRTNGNTSLRDGTAYTVRDATPGTANIDAAITVSETNLTVDESGVGQSATFTVVLNKAPVSDVVVDVTSADTGEATVDIAQLTFTASNWNIAQTVTVSGVADSTLDANQLTNVTVAVNDASSFDEFDGLSDTVAVTTNNTDTAAVTIADVSVAEDGTMTFTATLDTAVEGGFTVDVSTTDGSATSPADFAAVTSQTLTFAGAANEQQQFSVSLVDDSLVEASEQLTVAMSNLNATSLSVGITDTATGTITDNDTPALIVSAASPVEVGENGLTGTIDVVLQSTPTANVDVILTPSDVDVDLGSGAGNPHTLTFTPGNASTIQTVTVSAEDDAAVEGAETLTISLSTTSSDGNFAGLTAPNVTVNITDNDSAPATPPAPPSPPSSSTPPATPEEPSTPTPPVEVFEADPNPEDAPGEGVLPQELVGILNAINNQGESGQGLSSVGTGDGETTLNLFAGFQADRVDENGLPVARTPYFAFVGDAGSEVTINLIGNNDVLGSVTTMIDLDGNFAAEMPGLTLDNDFYTVQIIITPPPSSLVPTPTPQIFTFEFDARLLPELSDLTDLDEGDVFGQLLEV